MRCLSFLALSLCASTLSHAAETMADRVAAASIGSHRSSANIARNAYRHPGATLEFFGLADGQSVLEIWPGGGWYTEILAPALRDHGTFSIASWDPAVPDQPAYRYDLPKQLAARFAERPDLYDQVQTVLYSPPQSASLGADGSYDLVLTFRNTHGWIGDGLAEQIFKEFARVLKPGGVLGVVQHRAAEGGDVKADAEKGYVSETAVKQLAEAAGLVFEAASEINANPRDTKDYPQGVWALPPSLDLGDADPQPYLDIGESDRMTLKFRKPAAP